MAKDDLVPCGVCGELVESWVRFHYAEPHTDPENPGHYVDGHTREVKEPVFIDETAPFDAESYGMAPPAPERPNVPKALKKVLTPLEEDVRWDGIGFLRGVGYQVYNMEQGYRPGPGHTRVGVGVPDTYFQGHGATGWIEFKRPDGKEAREKQTDDQKSFERYELENGGVYLLVESVAQLVEWDRAYRGKQLELKT